jgi:hypothetical protein
MKRLFFSWYILVQCSFALSAAPNSNVQSLAGTWRFQLDPAINGLSNKWFESKLAGQIRLPGSTDEAKVSPLNTAKPNLDGLYRLRPYFGPAWYQRDLEIPAGWSGKRIRLFIERAHWETQAWLDGKSLGSQDSLISPQTYELGSDLASGKHQLTLCVNNQLKYNLGWFVSIHYEGTQTSWNGMIGRIELQALDPVSIEDLQVYPEVDRNIARVKFKLANAAGQSGSSQLLVSAADHRTGQTVGSRIADVRWTGTETTVEVELPMGSKVKLWGEFSPALYDLTATLTTARGGQKLTDTKSLTFGMRKLTVHGTQFVMNDRPLFLRGTLECGIFPLTGYPPATVPEWQRIFRILKSYGLNFIRFHSWCPPEAAFAAADIEGIYIQAEGPEANIIVGNTPELDAFMEQELLRMVRTYGNHPSFCLMTLGNEHNGVHQQLDRWVDMLVREDPRHFYSSSSAGEATANRQFTESDPRGVRGPGTDKDFGDTISKQDRPLIGHEIGQWTFYPDFNEIKKYTGVLAAKNFELVRKDLEAKHQLDLAPQYVQASGRHSVLLYKEEIEVLLRTPGHTGFSLLDLHDYPGQGTALIGPLDPFWDSKGFVSPEQHRRYCGPTVPLLRLKQRAFTTDEPVIAEVDPAHFGPKDLAGVTPKWVIKDEKGRTVAAGSLAKTDVPTGKLSTLGPMQASLAKVAAPCKLRVTVSLAGTKVANDWDIWVYPANPAPVAPTNVFVAKEWNADTAQALAAGKRVVLFASQMSSAKSLAGRFLPVFWSPVWFPTQKPNTMGILCDPRHPALAEFPTEAYSNWQWWDIVNNSRSIILDDAPATFRPVIQIIDNFARNHRLSLLLEARVDPGSLLLSTIPLPDLAAKCPPARQLLQSLYDYAGSDAFHPAQSLDVSYLDTLLVHGPRGVMLKLGAKILRVDSEVESFEAVNMIDDDPKSIWHTSWGDDAKPLPHEVVISFQKPVKLAGLRILPRQDVDNGKIKDYLVAVSDDDQTWQQAAKGKFDGSSEEKEVLFAKPQIARYLKLTALSAYGKGPFVSIAELVAVEAK